MNQDQILCTPKKSDDDQKKKQSSSCRTDSCNSDRKRPLDEKKMKTFEAKARLRLFDESGNTSAKRRSTRSVHFQRLFAYQCDEKLRGTKEINPIEEEVAKIEKRLSAITLDELNDKSKFQKRNSSKF